MNLTLSSAWNRVSRGFAAVSLAITVAVLATSPARAEYRIQPGDTVDFALIGMADLKQRSIVGPDGEVYFPLIGPVRAAGLSLSELKSEVRGRLNNQIYRQISPDGREATFVLTGAELNLDIAAYRPVYVNGDVLKPGEQPYRPGMTVRQAVSVAGGYDVLKLRFGNPLTDPVDFSGEHAALASEYVREQARNIRLSAELSGAKDVDFSGIKEVGPMNVDIRQIVQTEKSQFQVRRADLKKEQDYINEVLTKADKRIATLEEQKERETQGQIEDTNELDRIKELVQKGASPVTRLVEARRTLLFSATRVLQTVTQITQMERDREDLTRRLTKVEDDFKKKALEELQDSNVKLGTIRSKIDALKTKLTIAAGPRMVQTEAVTPRLVIHRRGKNGPERIEAELDRDLSPGDVVEVTVPIPALFNAVTGDWRQQALR